MDSPRFLFRAWRRLPRVLRRTSYLGVAALFSLCLFPGRASAQAQVCPGKITTDFTLTGNLAAASGGNNPCIEVVADGVTVNLGGNTLDVSALGPGQVAIATDTSNNTTIVGNGGQIITAYGSDATASAIESQGGTNLSIMGITFLNKPGGSLCDTTKNTNENYGGGISLDTVTGASVSTNDFECYQTGILVQSSVIPRRGTGVLNGNTFEGETFSMNKAGQNGIYSAGIVLSMTSGWSVTNNGITNSGSTDKDGNCVSSPPGVISCSFALQIIDGSSGNSITSNNVFNNFSGGIYTGPDTSKNTIVSNDVINNPSDDLYDDAPKHSNAWRRNTCFTEGGNVSPQKCP